MLLEKFRSIWEMLSAPYDERLEEAIETVCDSCQYEAGYCPLCPVTYISEGRIHCGADLHTSR